MTELKKPNYEAELARLGKSGLDCIGKTHELHMGWVIALHHELREEINRRSREQYFCVYGSILAIGATASLMTKGSVTELLLSVLPWILSVLGIYWCDHASSISRIGVHEKRLEKYANLIRPEGLEGAKWNSEGKMRKEIKKWKEWRNMIHLFLPASLFFFPSIASFLLDLYISISENFSKPYSSYKFFIWPIDLISFLFFLRMWWIARKVANELTSETIDQPKNQS